METEQTKPKRKRIVDMEKNKIYKERYCSKSEGLDTNSKDKWSDEDTELIMKADRPSDLVLAEQLGRSLSAIMTRRSKCGGTFPKESSFIGNESKVNCEVRHYHPDNPTCLDCGEETPERSLQCRGINI